MSELDEIQDIEKERIKINNELVVPSYRQFCKENGLRFHFWDELPKEKYNPEIAQKEMKLHQEAMNCFNNLKPKYVLFDNKIYSFHFTDWGGDFDYDSWEVQDFLNNAYDEMNKSKLWEKQARFAVDILTIIAGLPIIALLVVLDAKFVKLPIPYVPFVIGIAIAFLVGRSMKKNLIDKPLAKLDSERNKYIKRLQALKKEFPSAIDDPIIYEKVIFEKAEELVDACRVLVGIFEPKIVNKYPELLVTDNYQWFTMYGTVACAACACIRIGHEIPKHLRTAIELRVQNSLTNWYEPSLKEYDSVVSYIKSHLLDINDRQMRYNYIFHLSAVWFISKLTGKDELGDRYSNKIAEEIANIFRTETLGYWQIEDEK